jgi:hypothetical protein
MKKNGMLAAVALLACATASPAFAKPQKTADEAAKATLGELPALGDGLQKIGISGADEAKKSGLDTAFRVYMVRLDRLGAYDGSQSEGSLLTDIEQALYPVVSEGTVKAVLGVYKGTEGWETHEISSPQIASVLVDVRAGAAAATKKAASSFTVVRIPSLQLWFVGEQTAAGLVLRSTTGIEGIGLAPNTPVAAKSVFTKLVPAARELLANPLK